MDTCGFASRGAGARSLNEPDSGWPCGWSRSVNLRTVWCVDAGARRPTARVSSDRRRDGRADARQAVGGNGAGCGGALAGRCARRFARCRRRGSMWMAGATISRSLTTMRTGPIRRHQAPAGARQLAREVARDLAGDRPRIARVLGEGARRGREPTLILERSGYREESYHNAPVQPAARGRRLIHGVFCVVTETPRVISEPRRPTRQARVADRGREDHRRRRVRACAGGFDAAPAVHAGPTVRRRRSRGGWCAHRFAPAWWGSRRSRSTPRRRGRCA